MDGGGEGGEVEVVRGLGVEGVDVDGSPVELGHVGGLLFDRMGARDGSGEEILFLQRVMYTAHAESKVR